MSFDRFLADLKQQAVAEGVSQRALAAATPAAAVWSEPAEQPASRPAMAATRTVVRPEAPIQPSDGPPR